MEAQREHDPRRRLVVVGGGISGLAAAHGAERALRDAGATGIEILLLEAADTVGGKARTVRRGSWLVETGPTGYLDNEPAVDRLVTAAHLEKVPANPAAAHRFIVKGGKLCEVAAHPLRFARSGLLSPLGLLRIAREPWVAKRTDGVDESVWEFARRRLGVQAADRLIAPMVLGVFAGDAQRISLVSAFPRMAELEAEYGSLIRALIKLKRQKKESGGPAGPSGALTSFEGGLQRLPLALAEHGSFTVRTGARVTGIAPRDEGGWRVAIEGDGEALPADAVVFACEAWNAAALLEPVAPRLARALEPIPHPPVIVCALGFGAEARRKTPRGFGALIPRSEGCRILGMLWDTHLFPDRSGEGELLMRVMLGGAVDPEVAGLDDEEIVRTARTDLKRLLDLDDAPHFTEIARWPRAIPQYEIGHREHVREARDALAELAERRPGLQLAGNYLDGIAFGKAARAGEEAGERAARGLLDATTD